MESYAWRDAVSYSDLMRFLEEHHELLVDFIEYQYGDAIDDFLDEYSYEFTEWCECEGIDLEDE